MTVKISRMPFLCLMLLFCTLFVATSCTNTNSSEVINSTVPSSSASSTSSEVDSVTSSSAKDTPAVTVPMDAVPEYYFEVDKSELTLTDETTYGSNNAIYEDKDGTKFEFDKDTGEYRGFTPPIVLSHEDFDYIPMDKLEQAANELASRFISVKEYERSYFYQEDTRIHKFSFCRKINGYPSADRGIVWLYTDGRVELVRFYNTDIFDGMNISAIDEKVMDELFYDTIPSNRICKDITIRTLTIEDNKLYLEYTYKYLETSSSGMEFSALDTVRVPLI